MKPAQLQVINCQKKRNKSQVKTPGRQGFTLIELLIVIAVLGVLAAMVLVVVNPGKRMAQTRDAQRKTQLSQVKRALEAYMAVNGNYPLTGVNNEVFGDAVDYGNMGYEGPNGYIPNLAPNHIKRLPQDPRLHTPGSKNNNCNSDHAGFLYKSDGVEYKIILHCTPENYDDADKNFIDPTRDGDSVWGEIVTPENCASQVTGSGDPWAYAVWSSETSKCW
ncbi:MAG: hypothetical protein A2958_02645 [Candidatus Levybacteria bacterium RIFCSPLOWO2_01_FULL_38_13]|nr:MAG: hypothetical protein A2629_03065 [Candidatus Levybacteria bacterium RIFCSPHIGHO2_01_FULL_41_15]OGH35236.1 MAG: hypothetical protein A2958_02645 [Candidatus Levybacteria bacterium RIFCSPLOWO2_01_FULL_38_13]